MRELPFQLLLSTLIASSLTFVCMSCSSEDDSSEESHLLEISEVIGCWKVLVSDTVTEYWQFSTAVDTDSEPQSRLASIDTPSGTYIITRVTESPQNHTQVMELLAHGAYLVNKLRHEILMSQENLSDYSTNFKVTIIDNQMTLDSGISSESPRVLVNVHRIDSNNGSDYANSLPEGTYLSFGGYEISVNDDYCIFIKHPLYKGYESELVMGADGINRGEVSFKKTGKNSTQITIRTSEWVTSGNVFYGFDAVEIEVNLQFWGDGYGIIKGGRTIRSGKHFYGDEFSEYIEEVTTFDASLFGNPSY